MYCINGSTNEIVEAGPEFGDCALQHVEFTDEGDVVVAMQHGATVYSGTTFEPVRSWTWAENVAWIKDIQAHGGLLYVSCVVSPHRIEVHVYE